MHNLVRLYVFICHNKTNSIYILVTELILCMLWNKIRAFIIYFHDYHLIQSFCIPIIRLKSDFNLGIKFICIFAWQNLLLYHFILLYSWVICIHFIHMYYVYAAWHMAYENIYCVLAHLFSLNIAYDINLINDRWLPKIIPIIWAQYRCLILYALLTGNIIGADPSFNMWYRIGWLYWYTTPIID